MRHRKAYRKFGLPSDQRRALLKSLTRNLLLNDRIVTTETRAKEVRSIVEKLVTIARKGGTDAPVPMRLHTRRMVRRYVDSNIDEFVRTADGKVARNPYYVVPRLFEEIAPRYMDRPGGYTRITRVGFRRGDGAPLVLLEFVEGPETEADVTTDDTAEAEASTAPVVSSEGRRNLFGLGRQRK